MSINREQRRKVADNLAAFMRREISDNKYRNRGQQIFEEIRRSDQPDKFALYNAAFGWMNPPGGDRKLSVDEITWQAMRSRLAFLESGLEMKREGYDRIPGPGIWSILASIIVAISLGYLYRTQIGFSEGSGPWFYIVLWCGLGFGTSLAMNLHARLPCRKESRDRFHPFNDEQQFREHQHLLERFRLPPYDAAQLQPPAQTPCSAVTRVSSGIGVVLLTLLQSVLPMIFGPLLLIGALKPGRRPRYYAVKGS